MTEAHVLDLLPAYALGALDADDLQMAAQHLAGCLLCREALSAFNETAGRLALSAPLLTPPVDLRARVVARVMASERGLVAEQRAVKATGPHVRETQAVFIPPLVSALPAHRQPVEQDRLGA